MNEDSYAEYVQTSTTDGELGQLQRLAEAQATAFHKVAELEAQLQKARDEYKDLAERQVPEAMDAIGMAEFKTTSGLVISVEEVIRAGIPKNKAPLAFNWLRENGSGALIKRVVRVVFGKGEDEKANDLFRKLCDEYSVEDDESVHAQTLGAWVREKLRKGEEIPLELFGVHRQRVAKLSG